MKKRLQFIIPITLILFSNTVFAQNTFVGTIKDSIGEPIVGATIQIKGTNRFATTDVNGQFSINVTKTDPFIVVVKLFGYKTQEIEVAEVSSAPLQIVLIEDTQLLSEVTVTA